MIRGDNIYKDLIIKYLNRLTISDIKNYAINKKIPISDNESQIIYDFIIENNKELLQGNNKMLSKLSGKIRDEVYENILRLYEENKGYFL